MDNLEQKVYLKEVIEFTAVANEYCAFVESAAKYDGSQILRFMQKLLPLLYSKVLLMPEFDSVIEEEQEKFVREEDWQSVKDVIIVKLGEANDYIELYDDSSEFSQETVPASISENLADIYQDLKDYLIAYSIGTVELMNEALWNCQDSFKLYWGQKLVSSLKAIHNALRFPDRIGQAERPDTGSVNDIDTSDWIISQRQAQLRKDRDEEI
jgi:hypothetical protein